MLLGVREFHRPLDVAEAVALLRRDQVTAAVLAGGTELTARTDHETEALIDLSRLGLNRTERVGDRLVVGAMTTLAALAADPTANRISGGLLAEAVRLSAPATIRAAATLGGTLAGTKGGEEIPAALLALNARVIVARPEPLEVDLADFLADRARLLQGALISHVAIPLQPGARGGFARVSRSPADRAIVCAAAVVPADGSPARIAIGGAAAAPFLLAPGAEPEQACSEVTFTGDFRAGAEYRSWVAPVLVRRALEIALGGER